MAATPLLTPALVLGAIRYGETSRIVRLATRDHGVVSGIAKGAMRPRSRFGASLQLLSEGVAHLIPSRASDLHTLAAFDLVTLHTGLARGIDRFAAASALAEAATRFIPPSPNPPLYEHLASSVAVLEAVAEDAVGVVALRGLWGLIGELGLAPSLTMCARNGEHLPPGQLAFSLRDGGLLCPRCGVTGATTHLGSDDREALGSFMTPGSDLPILDHAHAAAHRRLFGRWVHHHLSDTPLPALDFWLRTDPTTSP